MASPVLKTANKQLVEYELARDYHAAGLLDRAESLLTDIVKRRDAQYEQAVELLVDLYEQERDWDEGNQEVIVDAWGIGVDAGAMIYPWEGAANRQFDIGFAPYARLALGFSNGDFENIETNVSGTPATSSGELGDLRFDFGVGVDVRAVVGRSFYFGVGAGWNWWTTTDGSVGTTRDGVGTILVADDEFDFDGSEGFVRATLGFYW